MIGTFCEHLFLPSSLASQLGKLAQHAPLRPLIRHNPHCSVASCCSNLWYQGGQFYYLHDAHSPPLPGRHWQLSGVRQNHVLSVRSAAEFAASVRARVVSGETVVSGDRMTRARSGWVGGVDGV